MKRFFIAVVALACVTLSGVSFAGATSGRISQVDRVEAYSTNTYRVLFDGGDTARVRVNGDNDTDLDLYVYDQFGTLVAFDNDELDLCIVEFRPRSDGRYRIEIHNLGGVYNQYTLETN